MRGRMLRPLHALCFIVIALLSACSPDAAPPAGGRPEPQRPTTHVTSKDLTREAAAQVLKESAFFAENKMVTLKAGSYCVSEPVLPRVRDIGTLMDLIHEYYPAQGKMLDSQLVTIQGDVLHEAPVKQVPPGCPQSSITAFAPGQVNYWEYRIVVSPRAVEFGVPAQGADVVTESKELEAVTGISSESESVRIVEFDWHWRVTDQVRKIFRRENDPPRYETLKARALLRLYDDGWRLANMLP